MLRTTAPFFRYDILAPVYHLGVGVELQLDNEEVGAVVVSQLLLFDQSVSDLEFLRALLQVRKGVALVANMVDRVVAEAGMSTPSTPDIEAPPHQPSEG